MKKLPFDTTASPAFNPDSTSATSPAELPSLGDTLGTEYPVAVSVVAEQLVADARDDSRNATNKKGEHK